MAEAARRMGSGLGADAARRLIARPLQRPATQPARAPASRQDLDMVEPAGLAAPDLTRRLETEILVMKAVLAAERRENAQLRAGMVLGEDDLGDEARAVRDRWAGFVDRLLQASH